jgi:hypothetical protein
MFQTAWDLPSANYEYQIHNLSCMQCMMPFSSQAGVEQVQKYPEMIGMFALLGTFLSAVFVAGASGNEQYIPALEPIKKKICVFQPTAYLLGLLYRI